MPVIACAKGLSSRNLFDVSRYSELRWDPHVTQIIDSEATNEMAAMKMKGKTVTLVTQGKVVAGCGQPTFVVRPKSLVIIKRLHTCVIV